MEQLIVTIKNGIVEIEVEGLRGTRCLELTQAIENLIGKVDARSLKNDFYKDIKTEQSINLKQGKFEKSLR